MTPDPKDEIIVDDLSGLNQQMLGSLIATGRGAPGGFNPKATAKRRAKNRVAAKSRRQNRKR